MVRTLFLLLAALPVLSACSPGIVTPLKLSDVTTVGDTGEPREVSAILRVPLPASSDCKAEIAAYVAKLAEIMPASGSACFTDMSAPHAEVDTKVWLIRAKAGRPEKTGLVIEIDAGDDRGKVYDLTLSTGVTLDAIERHLGMDSAVTNPEIVFSLENDLGREVGVQFASAFYNERPAKAEQGFLLLNAERTMLRLSDVSTALVAGGEDDPFMSVFDMNRRAE